MSGATKQKIKAFFKSLFSRNEIIFGLVFVAIFFVTFSIMYAIGLIPEEFLSSSKDSSSIVSKLQTNSLQQLGLGEDPSTSGTSQSSNVASAENPIRIVAPSISLDSTIVNPSTTNYQTLDNALTQGAVHYPGSGSVEDGNMFIFGHSTGYKIVNNKAYQVFNNIHSLKEGDMINIYTGDKEYVYKVEMVRLVDSREELVDFSNTGRMLTLSTCNSFGQQTDRYVVQASFNHTIDI